MYLCCHRSYLPIVQQNVRAFDVPVEKVLLVAVVKAFHQLSHETAYVLLGELDQARLQKTHQVVVHVLKHQIEGTLTHRQQDTDSKLGIIHTYH